MSTVLITGADRKFFLMACALRHSLQRHAPQLPLLVLDFGLDEAQRHFLRQCGALLETPPALLGAHPFVLKAAMGEYLAGLPWDTVVWLDSDMVAAAPLEAALAALLAEMSLAEAELAVCIDDAGTLATASAAEGFGPFAAMLRAEGADLARPYYNTGMLVCRSRRFLAEWRDLTQAIPRHVIFEQNAFNVLVSRGTPPLTLAAARWNRHGALLPTTRLELAPDGEEILAEGIILHATSSAERHHQHRHEVALAWAGGVVTGNLKLFRDPTLRRLQWQALTGFLTAEETALRQCGVLADGNGEPPPPTPPRLRDADRAAVLGALHRGDPAGAEAACLPLLHGADTAEALYLLAACRAGRDDEAALALFQAAAALQPGRADIAYELGVALYAAGRHDEALAAWRRTVDLAPDHIEGWRALAMALEDAGSPAEAVTALQRVLDRCPDDAIAHRHLAELLLGLGRIEEATAPLLSLLQASPAAAAGWRELGRALFRLDRLDEAGDCLRTALSLDSGDAESHRSLMPLLLRRGLWRDALVEWEWRALPWGPPSAAAALPVWTGREPPGTRVLLWHDQNPEQVDAAFLPLCRHVLALGHEPVLVPPGAAIPVVEAQFKLCALAHRFAAVLTEVEWDGVVEALGRM